MSDEHVFPSLDAFKRGKKGQSSYASMLGCIMMHFLGGNTLPPKGGWDHWKEFYYMESNKAGLTTSEANDFLNRTCLILLALGVIDPPEDFTLGREETIH